MMYSEICSMLWTRPFLRAVGSHFVAPQVQIQIFIGAFDCGHQLEISLGYVFLIVGGTAALVGNPQTGL